jgi:hypothetical protein
MRMHKHTGNTDLAKRVLTRSAFKRCKTFPVDVLVGSELHAAADPPIVLKPSFQSAVEAANLGYVVTPIDDTTQQLRRYWTL